MKNKKLLAIILIIASLSLAIGAHLITTSSGGTSFSTDETIQTIFNISVNNTNAGQVANITSVNITLPSAFTFTLGTNATSASESVFANASNILSWTNTTGYIVNGSETIYFWFNATATPGTYNFTINTTNITGSYETNISVEVNDTTNPTASFGTIPANATSTPNRTIIFSVKCADTYTTPDAIQLWGNWNGSWTAEVTNSSPVNDTFYNITLTSISDGTWTWAIYCNDSAGNGDWTDTNRTLIIRGNPTASFGTNPIATYNNSIANITFDIKCADPDAAPDAIQLWGNWSSGWHANNTNSSPANNTFSNITLTGLSDGWYKWAVYCNDSEETGDWTDTNRTFSIDTTNPNATAACSASTIHTGDPITCTCTGADDTSGVASETATLSTNPTLSGTYTYTCAVTDYAGNDATNDTATYIVTSGSGTSSSSGGGSTTLWTATFSVTNSELAESINKKLSVKQRLKININSQEHYIGILKLTSTTATISISSTPQEITLSISEEKKLELTGDNYYDLIIKLNSISENKADITIQSIFEQIPKTSTEPKSETTTNIESKTTKTSQTPTTKKSTSNSKIILTLGIIIAAIIIIIALISISLKKPKKKR